MEKKLTIEQYNEFSEKFIFKYEGQWVEQDHKTLSNGIILAGSPDNIVILEEILKDFDTNCWSNINSEAVVRIAIGEMPYNAPGGFCVETKTIKMHPITSGKDREYSADVVFAHEYAHAMDFHVDLQKHFRDDYKAMIEAVGYAYHESEDYSWKIGVEPPMTGNIMEDMKEFYSNFENHQKVAQMGYCGLRCVLNIREFVAMAFMHWFNGETSYTPEFRAKVEKLLKEYFLKKTNSGIIA